MATVLGDSSRGKVSKASDDACKEKPIKLTDDQKKIIDAHEAWLQADKPSGDGTKEIRRAVLLGDWKDVDLSGRRLCDAIAQGVDLRCADLRGAELRGVDFSGADLRGAELRGADFSGAKLQDASLRESDLRGAKLKGSCGLSPDCLGGANLYSAELPDEFRDFAALKTVEQASSYVQLLFKIILALCAFNALTVLSFSDDQLLLHSGVGSTELPLIKAAISPSMFAFVVPFIILLFQIYFAVYTNLLWNEFATLPAIFPDGTSLDRRSYPTLFNSYVRLHFHHLQEHRIDWAQAFVSTFLAFSIPPLTIFCSWVVYLSKHNHVITVFQSALFTLSCGLFCFCLVSSRPVLRGDWSSWLPKISYTKGWGFVYDWWLVIMLVSAAFVNLSLMLFSPSSTVNAFIPLLPAWIEASLFWLVGWIIGIGVFIYLVVQTWRRSKKDSYVSRRPTVVVLCFSLLIPQFMGLLTVAEPVFDSANHSILVADNFQHDVKNNGGIFITEPYAKSRGFRRHWLSVFMNTVFRKIPFLDITDKEISVRPQNWSGRIESEALDLRGVRGADLEYQDLRSIDANRAFLAMANLHDSRLQYANLRNADLRGADLRNANLTGAILRNANLKGAWLFNAVLKDALLGGDDPFEPNHEGKANLQEARLEGATCHIEVIKKSRNYALAYFGVRNGLELHRYCEAKGFDKLDDDAYRKALEQLIVTPNKKDVDKDFMEVLRIKKIAAVNAGKGGAFAGFLNDVESFVVRNQINAKVLSDLQLEFRTDEQVLNRQFAGYKFVNMSLREADFRKADLRGANFNGASLQNAQFQDADLRTASFTNADLRGSNLERSKLHGATFENANFLGAEMTDVSPDLVKLPLTLDQLRSTINTKLNNIDGP